eukprot:GHVU01141022.1.p2 GENE.GHVU01141022.1~~GHVU01141022.1.p2  ORF type:complete len:103 (+),score=16.14 GHVU01141022.1:523-831(+)
MHSAWDLCGFRAAAAEATTPRAVLELRGRIASTAAAFQRPESESSASLPGQQDAVDPASTPSSCSTIQEDLNWILSSSMMTQQLQLQQQHLQKQPETYPVGN